MQAHNRIEVVRTQLQEAAKPMDPPTSTDEEFRRCCHHILLQDVMGYMRLEHEENVGIRCSSEENL